MWWFRAPIPTLIKCSVMSLCHLIFAWRVQLLLRSETLYFPAGSIIADSKSKAKGIMVITSGQVWRDQSGPDNSLSSLVPSHLLLFFNSHSMKLTAHAALLDCPVRPEQESDLTQIWLGLRRAAHGLDWSWWGPSQCCKWLPSGSISPWVLANWLTAIYFSWSICLGLKSFRNSSVVCSFWLVNCRVCCFHATLSSQKKIVACNGFCGSDSIGGCSIVGDKRWAGAYGINADFIASSHCSVEYISKEAIKVQQQTHLLIRRTLFKYNIRSFAMCFIFTLDSRTRANISLHACFTTMIYPN